MGKSSQNYQDKVDALILECLVKFVKFKKSLYLQEKCIGIWWHKIKVALSNEHSAAKSTAHQAWKC